MKRQKLSHLAQAARITRLSDLAQTDRIAPLSYLAELAQLAQTIQLRHATVGITPRDTLERVCL